MTNTTSSRYYLFGPVIPRNFPAKCSSQIYIYIYTHVWAVSWAIMMADVRPMSLLTVLPNSEEQVEPTAAKPKNWLNDEVFCS